MNLSPKSIARYTALSDREIVDRIIRVHDMEAGVYLLWYRYESLIHSNYTNVFNNSISYLYEDALISLFITLCGENGEWEKLASFNWQCKFSSWLSIVSLRYFYSIKDKMIISAFWYRYIGVLVPVVMLPRRGLLAPLAAPLPSVFFIELGLRPWTKGARYQFTATSGTIVRYERYQ